MYHRTFYDYNLPGFPLNINHYAFPHYANPIWFPPDANTHGFPPNANPPEFPLYNNSMGVSSYANLPAFPPYGNPAGIPPYVKPPYNLPMFESDDDASDYGSDVVDPWDEGEVDLPKIATTQLAILDIFIKSKQAEYSQQADLCSKKKEHSARRSFKKKRKNNQRKRRQRNQDYDDDDRQPESSLQREDQPDEFTKQKGDRILKVLRRPYTVCMVNVDGRYEKQERGGYGAVLTDSDRKPIAAAYGVSRPVSVLYHQLQGVKRGLQLAKEYGCPHVEVYLNSPYAYGVVSGMSSPYQVDCHSLVAYILDDIVKLSSEFTWYRVKPVPKDHNRAADYLAKCGAEMESQPKRGLIELVSVDIKPDEFGDKLKRLLYGDAPFTCTKGSYTVEYMTGKYKVTSTFGK